VSHTPTTAGSSLTRRVVVADRGDAGVRLDRVLLRRLADVPGLSRTRAQRWIEAGQVRVAGRGVTRVAARVAAGDEIAVIFPAPPPRRRPQPEPGVLDVIHQDERLLAIDKPAGQVVHPAHRHAAGTLLNVLLHHARTDGWIPRLLHRLDRHTSGVLLVTRSAEAHRALARAWSTPAVRKHYLAICLGRPPRVRGDIRLPLARDPIDGRRVIVAPAGGREAVTRYEVMARSRPPHAGLSLVRCELLTGRTHQIRVHLAEVGCPVAGDGVYGARRRAPDLNPRLGTLVAALRRHALHAWRVALRLPGEPSLDIVAPLPADLRELLAGAGIDPGVVEAAAARLSHEGMVR